MDSVVHGLAENNYVVSIANLGGIIALLVLLYGFTQWAYRFGKAAYRQNIRVAIYRARRRNYVRARRAALDLHTFVSIIVIQGVAVLFGALASVIGAVAWVTRFTLPPEERISAALQVSQSWDRAAGVIMLYAPLTLLLFVAWKLVRFSMATRRIRSKLMVRKWRNAAKVAAGQK